MRLEMDGREPLVVLFGVPLLTTVVVLGSYYFGRHQGAKEVAPRSLAPIELKAKVIIPKDAIKITNKISTGSGSDIENSKAPVINATLVLPEGSIKITNRILIPDNTLPKARYSKKRNTKSEVVPAPTTRQTKHGRELVINSVPKISNGGQKVKLTTTKARRVPTPTPRKLKQVLSPKKTNGTVKAKIPTRPRTNLIPKAKPKLTPDPVSMVKPKKRAHPNIPGPEGEVLPPPKGIQVKREEK